MADIVYVVGLGPGDPQFLTAQAQSALEEAEVLCGYPVYLDLVRPYYPEKEYYATGMTKELDRCRWALETAHSGRTVALVGPSGGGKTTAASLIPRFWDVTSGMVKVGGADVRQIDPHVLMEQIAFVFQNSRLFKASILENVRASRPNATRGEVRAALMAAQCGDILEKLPKGIDTQLGPEGTYLSGGEQQRIALARAILKDAPIVVLDEATAFADPENEALIQKAFTTLTKGRTVIMIAHRLSTVVGADKILVLEGGRVVEQGSHRELVETGGLYARMWADYNQAVQWKITSEQ